MTQQAKLYFVHATSPLHAGVGAGLDAINLPTARERWTGYPFLPGSSVKGVLREVAERLLEDKKLTEKEVFGAFGPSTDYAGDARGGLVFSDASLLALPVRSLFGTFAWGTCPYVLGRLLRDAEESAGINPKVKETLKSLSRGDGSPPRVAKESALIAASDEKLYLEELLISGIAKSEEVDELATWIAETIWPGNPTATAFLANRLVVLKDDLFGFFTRTATEIRHRVKIDPDTGTAAKSGPWTEEHLPAETLLHGLLIGRPTRYFDRSNPSLTPGVGKGDEVKPIAALKTLSDVLEKGSNLRFGGKSTAGMGRARMRVAS